MRTLPVQPDVGSLDIDAGRLLRRVAELARIGQDGTGGITREGFSAADREARGYLTAEARAAGLVPAVDAAGNILIRLPHAPAGRAGRQVLLMGSHLDTVVQAGPLDGAYGVLAALEVLQALAGVAAQLRYDPVAVAFANEEGALFPQPFWGSMVLAGRLDELPREPVDYLGRPLRGPLALAGGDLDALGGAVWTPGSIAAYLELHVEQGPVLERGRHRIGVVQAITGRTVLTIDVRGTAGHAGTTPLQGRRDALVTAAQVVLAAEAVARERGLCRVVTVGRIDVQPNSPNTIADTVRLTVDLRDADPDRMRLAETAVRDAACAAAQRSGTDIGIAAAVRSAPVPTSPALRASIERSAAELGLPAAPVVSGAGHDAQVVARVAPMGMIFVPSLGGLSHVPAEDTAPADLVAGTQVLLRTALRLAYQGVARLTA
jgi:beta-ureidopropionase / N-carbamoyl-L-amino-acid hydrolase